MALRPKTTHDTVVLLATGSTVTRLPPSIRVALLDSTQPEARK